MDLSWCIICDRHCVGESLYCSESCRFQDNVDNHHDNNKEQPHKLISPNSHNSPILTPFLYSFQQARRPKISTTYSNNSNSKDYPHFPYRFTPNSPTDSSFFTDDT